MVRKWFTTSCRAVAASSANDPPTEPTAGVSCFEPPQCACMAVFHVLHTFLAFCTGEMVTHSGGSKMMVPPPTQTKTRAFTTAWIFESKPSRDEDTSDMKHEKNQDLLAPERRFYTCFALGTHFLPAFHKPVAMGLPWWPFLLAQANPDPRAGYQSALWFERNTILGSKTKPTGLKFFQLSCFFSSHLFVCLALRTTPRSMAQATHMCDGHVAKKATVSWVKDSYFPQSPF